MRKFGYKRIINTKVIAEIVVLGVHISIAVPESMQY